MLIPLLLRDSHMCMKVSMSFQTLSVLLSLSSDSMVEKPIISVMDVLFRVWCSLSSSHLWLWLIHFCFCIFAFSFIIPLLFCFFSFLISIPLLNNSKDSCSIPSLSFLSVLENRVIHIQHQVLSNGIELSKLT